MVNVGILAIQGDVSEHVKSMKQSMRNAGIIGDVSEIRYARELKNLDALVIPGGESTTIAKIITERGIDKEITRMAGDGRAIMGTCAGLVMLAEDGGAQVKKTGQSLLGLMDIKVNRNAFGRQRESFEADIGIPALGKEPFHAIFIRGPVIESAGKDVEILAEYEGKIVMAMQDNVLGLSFHPELGDDTRVNEYFLEMAEKPINK